MVDWTKTVGMASWSISVLNCTFLFTRKPSGEPLRRIYRPVTNKTRVMNCQPRPASSGLASKTMEWFPASRNPETIQTTKSLISHRLSLQLEVEYEKEASIGKKKDEQNRQSTEKKVVFLRFFLLLYCGNFFRLTDFISAVHFFADPQSQSETHLDGFLMTSWQQLLVWLPASLTPGLEVYLS